MNPAEPIPSPLGGGISTSSFHLAPASLLTGPAGSSVETLPLAGGALRFADVAVIWRESGEAASDAFGTARHATVSLAGLRAWATSQGLSGQVESQLAALTAPRPPWAGLTRDRPRLMGIINVTPDSFSDGGRFLAADKAIAHGVMLLEQGADILDIGGESTRPGAAPVAPDEEAARILPVVRELARRGALVSIDTRRASVMAQAAEAGAGIINDVTALSGDPASLAVAARTGLPVVLMHMQGEPGTMQHDPRYDWAPLDIFEYLAGRVTACEAAGIMRERLCIDPGIGFGKGLDHTVAIFRWLGLFHGLGLPLLMAASRKSFIGRIAGGIPAGQRLPGSIATALATLEQGAQILRVHDVAETVQAISVWRTLRGG